MVTLNRSRMIVLGMYATNKFGNPSTANGLLYVAKEYVNENGRPMFTLTRDIQRAMRFSRDIDAILFNEKHQQIGNLSKPLELRDVKC